MTSQSLRLISSDSTQDYQLRGDNTIKVTADGQVTHRIAPGIIEERYRCFCNGTRAVFMEEKKRLEHIGRLAHLWHAEPERGNAIWLEETAKDEAGARRSLIYDVRLEMRNQGTSSRVLNEGQVYGELIITRMDVWEAPEYETSTTTVDLKAGYFEISGKGTAPGRISRIVLDDPSTGPNDFWIGIREKGQGYASFNPFVEAEDLTLGVDASSVVNAIYSGGNAVEIDFATDETMTARLTAALSDFAASDYEHMFGEYLVIAGYRMTDSFSVIRMQLAGDTVIASEPVLAEQTGANVEYAELGRVRIPAKTLRGYTGDAGLADIGFDIEAEILDYSGSPGSLFIDFVVLVPARHMLKISNVNTSGDIIVRFYTHEDGETAAVKTDAAGVDLLNYPSHEANDFYLPPDECLLVLFGAQDVGAENGDISLTLDYYPRFESYRGVTE